MATSTYLNQNYAYYGVGNSSTATGVGVWGYVTTSGTDVVLIFAPGRYLLGNVSGFTLNSLTMQVYGTSRSLVGGSTSYNPLSDSTVTVHSTAIVNGNGALRVTLRKSSSWGFKNNTTLFGTINVSVTYT